MTKAVVTALIAAGVITWFSAPVDAQYSGNRVDPCVEMRDLTKVVGDAPDNPISLTMLGEESFSCANTYRSSASSARASICDAYTRAGSAYTAASKLMDTPVSERIFVAFALESFSSAMSYCDIKTSTDLQQRIGELRARLMR